MKYSEGTSPKIYGLGLANLFALTTNESDSYPTYHFIGGARATKWSPVIKNQGGGEFCEEILTPNLHFNGLIEAQYLKARFFFLCF